MVLQAKGSGANALDEVRIGSRTLQPRRQLLAGGERLLVGKRALDILSVLAEAGGEIVTKDELLDAVWPGVTVEENALQVHIVALRKALGPDADRLQTIRGVGYQLDVDTKGAAETAAVAKGALDSASAPSPGVEPDSASAQLDPQVPSAATPSRQPMAGATDEPEKVGAPSVWPSRRAFVVGAAMAGIAGAVGGGALLYRRIASPSATAEAQRLMDQAWLAWTQGTREGNSQAIGLYRRATEVAPGLADAWGFLGCAYGDRAHAWARAAEIEPLHQRARAAGQRALRLDSKNAYGRAAIAYARPMKGNWLLMEREFRRAINDQPEKWLVIYSLALLLTRVGRNSEAAILFGQVGNVAPTATQYQFQVRSLWAAGQLDEAERLMDEATSIYATHAGIWFARFDLLLFSGRAGAALAMAQDTDARPTNVAAQELVQLAAIARAIESRDPALANEVVATQIQASREEAQAATRAIELASALGRLDEAFAIADAFYFSRGFAIPNERIAAGQLPEITLDERETRFLFLPSTRRMRADPRFKFLVEELGLERYWREAGAPPDYLRA